MPKAIVGVKKFYFDAAHYTPGVEGKCQNIHGHTYRLDVEVEGEINKATGMVIDFLVLKKIVKRIVEEYDHKIIVPRRDLDKVVLRGPFNVDVKVIDYPFATTEYLALDIAKRIFEKIGLPVKVKLFEGPRNYVVVKWSGEEE